MTLKEETINTYNTSAREIAEKFNSQGARIQDIDYVFSMQDTENPFVLEIGCGNGRDAVEINKRSTHYLGIDISEKLIAIAKETVSGAHFEVADIETYTFPKNIDIVFAFASLIHVTKESLQKIMAQLFTSVSQNGLVFVSLKHSEKYKQVTKTDEFGVRTYWHYSQSDMADVASGFIIEHTSIQDIRGQVWMEVLFRKK